MIQLRQPNLGVIGLAYYCYAYVDSVFGLGDMYYSAWEAWLATQFKRYDALPDVAVPVWFSWTGTVDGEYRNWGHAAVWVPGQGVFTSPLSGQGHLVYPTIAALESAWGVKYVGWSEDLSGVRIAVDMLVDKNNLKYLYLGIYGVLVPDDKLATDSWIGKDYAQATQAMLDYANRNGYAYWQYIPNAVKQITDLKLAVQKIDLDNSALEQALSDCEKANDELQKKLDQCQAVDEQVVVEGWLKRLWKSLFNR